MNKLLYILIPTLFLSLILLLLQQSINPQADLFSWVIFGATLLVLSIASFRIYLLYKQVENSTYINQKAAKIGSWHWDIKKQLITFSDIALNIMDIDSNKAEYTIPEFMSLIYQPDRKGHVNTLTTSLKTGKPYRVELRCNTKKPFKPWLLSKGEIYFDVNNQPESMIGMHQDITHIVIRRLLQEKIKTILQNIIAHEDSHLILSRICAAVNEVEPSIFCVIYKTNKKANDRLQLHHGDNLPDTLRHVLNSITIDDKTSELVKTMEQSKPLYIDDIDQQYSWLSANQMLKPLQITAYYGQPLLSGTHTTRAAICLYIQDKSIPMEIIEQILMITSQIAVVAIEGQHQTEQNQLVQQQLYHSQKMDSIGHLTAGIAHDFNNILGSIVGYTSLARKIARKRDNDRLNHFLDEVSIASKRARDLISQMMMFSRKEPSEAISVDTKPVIKEVLQLIHSMLPSSITMEHHFEDDIDNISINPIALHQVIMNLLINAKDAMENNVGHISIKLYSVNLDSYECASCHELFSGHFVCIEIKDTGSGIPPNLIEHIFDPFFTTKDVGQGTGMGLSVIHGILHECKGHISVTSKPEPYTLFKLYFPIIEKDLDTKESNKSSTPELIKSGNGEHVMVVDDDIPLSLLFEEIINSYGYKVSRFDNSQEALQAFLTAPDDYQLIVSDQTMPFLTGDKMATKMLKTRPSLPIIICTGFSESLNEEKAAELGIYALIHKPVAIDHLIECINSALAES